MRIEADFSFGSLNNFVKVQKFDKVCCVDIIKICVNQRLYEVNPFH